MTLLVALDPGKSGCIATYNSEAENPIVTYRMPETEQDTYEILKLLKQSTDRILGLIEEITTWGMQPNAQCLLYGNYKQLRGFMIALSIPFDDVPPKQWQKEIGITYPKGTSYNERKKAARAKAQQMFPQVKVDAQNADALLILEFLRRRELK